MCSIIGSYNKDTFLELLKLNEYRGSFSHSLMVLSKDNTIINKALGPFNKSLLDGVNDGNYMLAHCQAPTNGLVKDIDRVHPCSIGDMHMLHNGIIKAGDVAKINNQINSNYTWDTQALCMYIKDDFDKLSNIEGSFACACVKDNKLYIFRNAISPLYIDSIGNISSTKFVNSVMIEHNTIFLMQDGVFVEHSKFNNTHNPYYF